MGGLIATQTLAKSPSSSEASSSSKGAASSKGESARDNSACIAMGINLIQSGLRYVNMKEDQQQAKNLRAQKLTLIGTNPVPKMAGDNSMSGNAGGAADSGGLTNPNAPHTSDTKTAQASDPTNASAATAALAPLLQQYEKDTGHSAADLMNSITSGESLPQYFAKTMGDKIGADGVAMLAAIDKQSQQLIAEHRDELDGPNKKLAVASASYETAAKGGGAASKGNDMPDFGALMSGLLGKKPGEEKGPDGTRALAFSNAAAKPGNEGLHPASRSIFEVVDTRYHLLSGRFLAGDALVKPQQSTLPANPYLNAR
jgi:hypothetical protein